MGGLRAAPELLGVGPPLAVLASVGVGLTGARGRGLGRGEQLVEVAAQNPHAPANAVAAHDSFECGSYFRMAHSWRNAACLKRQPGECRPTVPISSDTRCLSESAGLATLRQWRGSVRRRARSALGAGQCSSWRSISCCLVATSTVHQRRAWRGDVGQRSGSALSCRSAEPGALRRVSR